MFRRDGQAIVIKGTFGDDTTKGVFITDGSGQGSCHLNNQPEAQWLVWSPNGSEIIFVDMGQEFFKLFKQSSQCPPSSSALDLTNNVAFKGRNMLWSDNDLLIFRGCADWIGESSKCGIWITRPDTFNPERIVVGLDVYPMDAKQGLLVYTFDAIDPSERDSDENRDWDIYIANFSDRDIERGRNLTKNKYQDGLPAIDPDGKHVAYISDEGGEYTWGVWSVDVITERKVFWFEIPLNEDAFDVDTWAGERMSWVK